MRECKKLLRLRFEAETDIVVQSCLEDWKKYAEWLEKLSVKQINCELEKENNFLRKRMEKAMDILEEGISGRYL